MMNRTTDDAEDDRPTGSEDADDRDHLVDRLFDVEDAVHAGLALEVRGDVEIVVGVAQVDLQ